MGKRKHVLPAYTLGEELFSAISHGIGALLGVAGLVLCLVKSAQKGSGYGIATSIVFGLSVILLYTCSCIYHALKRNRGKIVFRVLDHCMIFLLIAGTYTPISLIALRDTVGWWLFGIIWGCAALGITFNAINLERYGKISMVLYLVMGWAVVFTFGQLQKAVDPAGVRLLIYGGLAYTLGAIVYGIGSKKKYFHSIWHLFVLAGTIFHFFCVYLYIL